MLIDTHCHLSRLSDEDVQLQIDAAKAQGVEWLVAIGAGYGIEDNFKTLHIANNHANIVCALAMHPHDAKDVDEASFQRLKQMIATEPKVRAVGEVGLDYHYMQSPKEVQIDVLRQFADLAHDIKKPLVIHDRDCDFECVDLLEAHKARDIGGVVHCFTGSIELAQRYLDLGFLISFTGIITFKKADELRDVVRFVPLDRMMVETDSPFLAPVPFRGKPNQPAYVRHVAEAVAGIKGVSLDVVAQTTTANACQLFGIQL